MTKTRNMFLITAIMSLSAPQIGHSADYGSYEGVATVYDGDGIYLTLDDGRKVRIRLFGLDAPETSQPCLRRDGTVYLCGRIATANLESLVAGRRVLCSPKSIDRYKRKVSVCYLGATDIGESIVSDGYARAWPKYSDMYVAAENKAKDSQQGFWSGSWEAPWHYRKTKPNR